MLRVRLLGLFKSSDHSIRNNAIYAAGYAELRDPEIYQNFLTILNDPDEHMAGRATIYLPRVAPDKGDATNRLLSLLKDPRNQVRSSAAHALADEVEPSGRVAKALVVAFSKEKDEHVLHSMAYAMKAEAKRFDGPNYYLRWGLTKAQFSSDYTVRLHGKAGLEALQEASRRAPKRTGIIAKTRDFCRDTFETILDNLVMPGLSE